MMTPMQMVEKAMAHGCNDYNAVLEFVFSNYKLKMRPSVAGNLLTQIRKNRTSQMASTFPHVNEKAREAFVTNPRLARMVAKFQERTAAKQVTAAKEVQETVAEPVVTVEFGEEVVKAVIEVIKKYGYDRVRGAVELSRWFYG